MFFFSSLPFIYSDAFIDPVLIPRQAYLTCFVSFVFFCLFFTKNFKKLSCQISLFSLVIISCSALLLVLSFISITYAHSFSESIYVASKYGIVFVFFIITYFLLNAHLIRRVDLINGVLVFGIISLCYGIYDVVFLITADLNVLSNAHLITATYANKNLFASALLLCAWAFCCRRTNNYLKAILIFSLAAFVVLLQSKIVTVAFGFMFLMFSIKLLILNFKNNKTIIIAISVLVIGFLYFILFNFSKFENLSDLHSLSTRLSLWENSFKMIQEKAFGVGVGNWQIFFPKYGLSKFDSLDVRNGITTYQRPHNDFIWMLCELGVQGLILYSLIFCVVGVMLIRLIRKAKALIPLILLLNIIGYCMVASFDFPLERIEHQVLFAVVILISMNLHDSNSLKKIEIGTVKYTPAYVALILVSFVVCCYRLKGEYYTKQFLHLNKEKYSELVIANCNKAHSPFYTIDSATIPLDWYAGISLFSQNRIEEALKGLEQAHEYTPYNIHILKNLGVIYDKKGDHIKAVEYYNKAVEISSAAIIPTLK